MNKNRKNLTSTVLETLEARTLFSTPTVHFDQGSLSLTITGTAGADQLSMAVQEWHDSHGNWLRDYEVEANGVSYGFNTPFIYDTYINGGGGNDAITVTNLPDGCFAHLTGGTGDDYIKIDNMDAGQIDVDGNAGNNTLDFRGRDFEGPSDYELVPNQIRWLNLDRVDYTNITNLNFTGSFDNDTIYVKSVPWGMNFNVDGQQGNDTIIVGDGNVHANILGALHLDGGSYYAQWGLDGDDTLIFDDTASGGGALTTLACNTYNTTFLSTPITFTAIDHESLYASAGGDYINVDSAFVPLKISAGAGNDWIRVDGGDLSMVGSVPITIDGGTGNDMITADDHLHPGATGYILSQYKFMRTDLQKWLIPNIERFDLLTGSGNCYVNSYVAAMNTTIRCGPGNDTVLGGPHNDSIYGGGGNDELWGNAGDDYIEGDAGSDYLSGGLGTDTVSYYDHTAGVKVNFNVMTGNGSPGENDSIFSDFEIVEGTNYADNITLATNRAGAVYAYAGNDTLTGGNMADSLFGGAGNDILKGNGSADHLDGGAGLDTLYGGAGNDTLIANDGEKDELHGDAGSNVIVKDAIDVVK
jgi:Ca2+-binding RTX toxin-like protein